MKQRGRKILKCLAGLLAGTLCLAPFSAAAVTNAEKTEAQSRYAYSIDDATRIQRIVAEYEPATEELIARYDVNHNGIIGISDATIVQMHVAEMLDINSAEYQAQFAEPTEEPTTEQPTTEQPTTEEPTTEQPTTEEPTTEQPTTEEPTTEQSTTEQPTTEQPTTEEPATEQPTTEEPATEAPTEEPTTAPAPAATYLIPETTSLTLGVNETFTLCYSTDAQELRFEVGDPAIAEVTDGGTIHPLAVGETYITCIADECLTADCTLTVGAQATSITLNAKSVTLGVGDEYQLNSTIPDGTAAYYRAYTSDNDAIAAVSADKGRVKAKAVGETYIRCRMISGIEAVCKIIVMPPATTITLNATALTLGVGETFDVNSYIPSDTAAFNRMYYSDNPAVASATVSGGYVKGVAPGSTTIRCVTQTGAEALLPVTVTAAPTKVTLQTYTTKELVGKTYSLGVVTDQGADKNRIFRFTSSDTSVVAITSVKNNTATLTPKSMGTATITIKTFNGKTATHKVTVYGTTVKCIDISTWQGGNVDFAKVKAAGINYVIIRAGFDTTLDNQFENNYAKAKAAGMKIGVYWFSYSMTPAGGVTEAKACLKALKGKKLDMPVYYDLEYEPAFEAMGTAKYTQMAYNFCNTIKNGGFKAGVYASASDYTTFFDPQDFYNRGYSVWNAHWASSTPVKCDVWQYTSSGSVSGVSGNVDMNYIYNLNIVG